MAERRMFSRTLITSDAFMDMPLTTQALYFHLGIEADDEGFLESPKRIQRSIRASDDDFRLLITKRFIISFDSGIIVIRHWRQSNYIQKDRWRETRCTAEKRQLFLLPDDTYSAEPMPGAVKLPIGKYFNPKTVDRSVEAAPALPEEQPKQLALNEPPESSSFAEFWEQYPRKHGRDKAQKEWDRLHPDEKLQREIYRALTNAKACEKWLEQNGRFIPSAANWLRDEGWKNHYVPARNHAGYDMEELERKSHFSNIPPELLD